MQRSSLRADLTRQSSLDEVLEKRGAPEDAQEREVTVIMQMKGLTQNRRNGVTLRTKGRSSNESAKSERFE